MADVVVDLDRPHRIRSVNLRLGDSPGSDVTEAVIERARRPLLPDVYDLLMASTPAKGLVLQSGDADATGGVCSPDRQVEAWPGSSGLAEGDGQNLFGRR
jgi:hypothetical protein